MRLPAEYPRFIKQQVEACRPDAALYLFGSRAGILVISDPELTWGGAGEIRGKGAE